MCICSQKSNIFFWCHFTAYLNHYLNMLSLTGQYYLGPVFFNCIMSELPSTLKDIGILSHLYADDTQFWVSFKSGDESIARRRVSHAFKIISRFMSCNSLKLNASKTQFLPIGRSIVHSDVAPLALDDNTLISPSSDVRH